MILYRYRGWNSSETNWDESIRYVNPRIQRYTCISGLCSRLMKKLCSTKKKKGCFEGNEARLFISCQGRSSRKWRCCMHRVHVAFNAVFRPLDFNEAAIFEYTAFDIISHLDYLLFSFHHWKARLNKWYVKYIVQFLILYYMVLLEHAKRVLLSRIRPTSETWLESISNEVLRTLLGIDITTFLSFARFFFQACALVYYS